MLSLVQNLVPPAGVYNLGTHRDTVKRNQIATTNYALRILNRFTSLSVRRYVGKVDPKVLNPVRMLIKKKALK